MSVRLDPLHFGTSINDGPIGRGAILSIEERPPRYRYHLWRRRHHGALLGLVMLNPSTADANVDDPTITRCMGFALRDGYAGISVVNLFAVRLTDSRALKNTPSPFGPDNQDTVRAWVNTVGRVVVAWGAHPMARGAWPYLLGDDAGPLWCFGTNHDGSPKHPLYLRGDTPIVPWTGYAGGAS